MNPSVVAVAAHATHDFSKTTQGQIQLKQNYGVEGDCHAGLSVQHRSRVAIDPTKPNLRQVHLLHEEIFAELAEQGFNLEPGVIGENLTTRNINLLALPTNTLLQIGPTATLKVTGLRNPCSQLDDFQAGLMAAMLDRTDSGELIRKAGIMAIVTVGGTVKPGDEISVTLPTNPHHPLAPV